MIDLSNVCIFNGSSDNLNTMKVVVDGQEYKIAISEEFEEEASLGVIKKKIREQAESHKKKHDLLQQLADELGYDLSPGTGGLIIAKPQEPERLPKEESWPEAQTSMGGAPKVEPQLPAVSSKGGLRAQKNERQKRPVMEGLDQKEAEAAFERATKRAAINQGENIEAPPAGSATSRPPHHIPSSVIAKIDGKEVEIRAPEVTAKTSQVVEGVGGFPVKIDRSSSSRVGDTNIKVIKSVNDRDLINITKQLEITGRPFSDCRACGGMGMHRVTNKECPRCDGTGIQV